MNQTYKLTLYKQLNAIQWLVFKANLAQQIYHKQSLNIWNVVGEMFIPDYKIYSLFIRMLTRNWIFCFFFLGKYHEILLSVDNVKCKILNFDNL